MVVSCIQWSLLYVWSLLVVIQWSLLYVWSLLVVYTVVPVSTMVCVIQWSLLYHGLRYTVVPVIPRFVLYSGPRYTMVCVIQWSPSYHGLCDTVVPVIPWFLLYSGPRYTMVWVMHRSMLNNLAQNHIQMDTDALLFIIHFWDNTDLVCWSAIIKVAFCIYINQRLVSINTRYTGTQFY